MGSKSNAQWVITNTEGIEKSLQLEKDASIPELSEYDCLVEIEAVSLNYRDLVIPQGKYPFPVNLPIVPGSDACGKVVSTGSKVSRFEEGARVCTLFNQGHQAGAVTPKILATGLGGALPGTLRKYGVFPETGLVPAPSTISPIEAATLSCAPLTAWNALYGLESKALKPGNVVLTQGTGGVSIAAVQLALAAGATVIATTSSASKAQRLKSLGAHHVINYKENPNWGATAKDLTPDKLGVDHILEVGGPSTLAQSLAAIKMDGVISIIGFLGGGGADQPKMLDALQYQAIVRGILVGNRMQFEDMNRAIDATGIKPVVDEKVFGFEQAKEAYQYMWEQNHFGKVVIKVKE